MTVKTFYIASVIVSSVFALACDPYSRQGPVALKMSKELRASCKPEQPCHLKAADMTDVSWDQLYVFDSRVERDVIFKRLGTTVEIPGPYYSNKWFFMNEGKIVHFEQKIIPEVDVPMKDGDVDIEPSDATKDFGKFRREDLFRVEKINTNPGEAFRLKCSTCDVSSPPT